MRPASASGGGSQRANGAPRAPATARPAHALPPRSLHSWGLASGPCGRVGTVGVGTPQLRGAAGRKHPQSHSDPSRGGGAGPAAARSPGPGSARRQGLPAEATQPGGLLRTAASVTAVPAAIGSAPPRSPRAQSAIVRGCGPGLRQRFDHRLLRRGSHGKGLPVPPLPPGARRLPGSWAQGRSVGSVCGLSRGPGGRCCARYRADRYLSPPRKAASGLTMASSAARSRQEPTQPGSRGPSPLRCG